MRKKPLAGLAAMLCAFLLIGTACSAGASPAVSPEGNSPSPLLSVSSSRAPLPEDAHPSTRPFFASATPLSVFSQAIGTGQCRTAAVSGGQLLWQDGVPPVYLEFQDASFDAEESMLTALLHNQDPAEMLTYGEHYHLQFRENEWQPWETIDLFPRSEVVAADLAYGLYAGDSAAMDFRLAEIPMPAGRYRFEISVDFRATGEEWLLGLEFELLTNEWEPPSAGEILTAAAQSDDGRSCTAAVSGSQLSWKNGDEPDVYFSVLETSYLTLLVRNHDTLFDKPCALVPTAPCQLFRRVDQRWEPVPPFTAENQCPNFDCVYPGLSVLCLAPRGIRLEPGIYRVQAELTTDTPFDRNKTAWRLDTEFEVP